mgnify:CR=1 FL=1
MFFKNLILKLKNCVLCRAKLNCRSSCCSVEDNDTPDESPPVINITGNINGSPRICIRTLRERSPARHDRREREEEDEDDEE